MTSSPDKRPQPVDQARPAAQPGTHRPIRVLLVDDNPLFLNAAGEVLARYPGVQVIGQMTNSAQAVDCVRSLSPDLVITDLVMPGMDGLTLTRQIKTQPGAPKVVIITLHDGLDSRAGASAAGADGFLPKHDFMDDALEMIQKLFPKD